MKLKTKVRAGGQCHVGSEFPLLAVLRPRSLSTCCRQSKEGRTIVLPSLSS